MDEWRGKPIRGHDGKAGQLRFFDSRHPVATTAIVGGSPGEG